MARRVSNATTTTTTEPFKCACVRASYVCVGFFVVSFCLILTGPRTRRHWRRRWRWWRAGGAHRWCDGGGGVCIFLCVGFGSRLPGQWMRADVSGFRKCDETKHHNQTIKTTRDRCAAFSSHLPKRCPYMRAMRPRERALIIHAHIIIVSMVGMR